MTDLEFLQLLIILTVFFWIIINVKKNKSKFAAGPSLTLPWNFNLEKNKLYLFMRDPLSFDLQFNYRTVPSTTIKKYNWDLNNFNYVTNRLSINMDESTRLDQLSTVNSIVKLQNDLVLDINLVMQNIRSIYSKNKNYDINLDNTAVTSIDITQVSKYKMLQTGKSNGNLLLCGDFETTYNADGSLLMQPQYVWETSPTYDQFTGTQKNNDIKGSVIFYQNYGDEYDVYDETSVKYYGGLAALGRATKEFNKDEKAAYEGEAPMWSEDGWKQAWNSFEGQTNCATEMCKNSNYLGYPVEKGNYKNDYTFVYRSFPPGMPDGNLNGKAAVLSYINMKNSFNSNLIPYIRQSVQLKKNVTYTLSFFYFGFVPLFVNFIDLNGNKTLIISQEDIGYNHWLYRSVDFQVSKDSSYYIEFILNIVGDEKKYYGTDPEKNNHKYHGRVMIDDVVLEVKDTATTFPNYSLFNFSEGIRDSEIYLVLNGKTKRFDINNSTDLNVVNQRRSSILQFIIDSYIS